MSKSLDSALSLFWFLSFRLECCMHDSECSYTLEIQMLLVSNISPMYFCRVGIELPMIEVRFNDLFVEAECEVVYGKPIPTLWNTIASKLSVSVIQLL